MKALVTRIHTWFMRVVDDRRQYFDEDVKPELWDLLQAASLLEVKEFVLFELAYRDWFGRRPRSEELEVHFTNYMFNEVIPTWVRRYSRKVVELYELGELDPKRLGIYKPLPSRRLQRIGKLYMLVLLVVLLWLTYVAYSDNRLFKTTVSSNSTQFDDRPRHLATP